MQPAILWRVTLATTQEAEQAVSALLEATVGAPTCSYIHFETATTTVSAYLQSRPEAWNTERARLTAGLRRLRASRLRIGPGRITLTKMRRQDWAESWKRHFKPIEVGTALLIQPSWSKRRPRPGQASMVLDPGLSFGTGQHPTTLYCLRQLVAARRFGLDQSVLDLGTGSGILAIAAAKLGFRRVEAVDLDPDSVRVARANAARNGVARRVRISAQDVRHRPSKGQGRHSLICANLITPLLLAHKKSILARLAPGGRLVVAGILAREFSEVQRAYEAANLRLLNTQSRREWRSGTFQRPNAS